MALRIYYSNRIEDLAEHLKSRLIGERTGAEADPFAFRQIVVPNTNIAKWLQIRMFADEPALCMGLEFPFIEQCLSRLMCESLDAGDRPRLLPMNAYANAIMAILLNDGDARLAPFRRYVSDGDGGPLRIESRRQADMAWQLSSKLAGLMDKYEVHRGEIIGKWLDEERQAAIKDQTESAEAALAQKLFGRGGVFPPDGNSLSLRQLFDRARGRKARAAGRPLYFFGLSTLSSLQVRILHWLAKTNEVVVYHNNVCLEYWGDVESDAERNRRKDLPALLRGQEDADTDIEIDNDLLRQWGVAGRETLRLLVDLEEASGSDEAHIDFEWSDVSGGGGDDGSMLAKVQGSVRNRTSGAGRVAKQDATIQIVGAPGVRREVEMVYNAILGAVWEREGSEFRPWGKCTFSDIAVLVPDMKTYRPAIESVFDGRGQIPYGLIDTSASDNSQYLLGFMSLMEMASDGLSRKTLFAVLDNPCVQNALGFTPADVSEWRRYADGAGAFEGFTGKAGCENFSWGSALTRLRLGMVADEKQGLPVWQGGGDSALRFSEIVETLHRELSRLPSQRRRCAPEAGSDGDDGNSWAAELRRVAGMFLAAGKDEPLELDVRRQLFRTLYSLGGIDGEQCLDFVVAAVEEFVCGIKCQKGGYLTHGVTVAGLQPMRPVPFKQVFVLGMGEGSFPGNDSESTLEIRGSRRTLGDLKPTALKKHMFLETLMATRDRLVVSYPDRDIVKDAELFPSGMIRELENFICKNILPETEDGGPASFKEVKLPLLERGEPDLECVEDPVAPRKWDSEYFSEYFAGLLPTYSNVERGIARDIESPPSARTAASPERPDAQKTAEITARELAAFLKSPLKAVLQGRCGIAKEGYRNDALNPDPPLEIASGPAKWKFQKAVLDAIRDDSAETDIMEVYARFAGDGLFPDADGMLGGYALEKAKADFAGDRTALLKALKDFMRNFLEDGWEKPAPVRTAIPAGRENGGSRRTELVLTGSTPDWRRNGTACRALVFNRCGDEMKRGEILTAAFPPDAVLEPLVTWLIMLAGTEGDETHSLRVGIADIDQMLYNSWNWEASPKSAADFVSKLADAYLSFLSTADADGRYLDCGYRDLAEAIEKARETRKIKGDFPAGGEWKTVVDIMSEQAAGNDFKNGSGGFDNNLVIGRTMAEWSRKPGGADGENGSGDDDAEEVERRFTDFYEFPMSGERDVRDAEGG